MGDPSKLRKKYEAPFKPWEAARIEEEKQIIKDYGLVNKREIWKMLSLQRRFRREAKKLIASHTPQADIEKKHLLSKVQSLGLISQTALFEDILGLTLNNILERRLQTQLVRKNFARTVKQARQFITHKHIMIGGKKITSPSYLVSVKEESILNFYPGSALSNPDHIERQIREPRPEKKPEKKEESKEHPKRERKQKKKKETKPKKESEE